MLSLRPTVLVSLMLAAIVTTASAGSNRKPTPSCKDCNTKFNMCIETCEPGNTWACEHDCDCQIASNDAFCRESCDMGGPESACENL